MEGLHHPRPLHEKDVQLFGKIHIFIKLLVAHYV